MDTCEVYCLFAFNCLSSDASSASSPTDLRKERLIWGIAFWKVLRSEKEAEAEAEPHANTQEVAAANEEEEEEVTESIPLLCPSDCSLVYPFYYD